MAFSDNKRRKWPQLYRNHEWTSPTSRYRSKRPIYPRLLLTTPFQWFSQQPKRKHRLERAYQNVTIRSNRNELANIDCIPNNPVSDDHHSFTSGDQKIKQWFASWAQLAERRSHNNAEHHDAKNIRGCRIDLLEIPQMQRSCRWNYSKLYISPCRHVYTNVIWK